MLKNSNSRFKTRNFWIFCEKIVVFHHKNHFLKIFLIICSQIIHILFLFFAIVQTKFARFYLLSDQILSDNSPKSLFLVSISSIFFLISCISDDIPKYIIHIQTLKITLPSTPKIIIFTSFQTKNKSESDAIFITFASKSLSS